MASPSIRALPVGSVHCDPQHRKTFSAASIQELAKSIQTCGQIQPILVRAKPDGAENSYSVVDGERRLRAIRDLLRQATINAIVDAEGRAIPVACTQLVSNVQREDLNPIEFATA